MQSNKQAANLPVAVINGVAEDARRYHRRDWLFINAAAEYPDEEIRDVIDQHRARFRLKLAAVCKAARIQNAQQTARRLGTTA